MEIIDLLAKTSTTQPLKCVEMHTTGEATRIIYSGFPTLSGSLLQQREQASSRHDAVRSRLMLEPRGHNAMYGAVLRQETERVASGEADIGVLFCHNAGWSTMCGHATIALGRFLVDTHDASIFPGRDKLVFDADCQSVRLRLHAPCGVVLVTVPTAGDGRSSDPLRQVWFVSVPSFAAARGISIPVPERFRWPQLRGESVVADVAYGGTFYCMVTPSQLGFGASLARADLPALENAAAQLKIAFNADGECVKWLHHPEISDVEFLYSVVVVDSALGEAAPNTQGAEFGFCFFADSQLDRSPTGSAVSARVALAYAKGDRDVHDSWTYHSLISHKYGVDGAFVARIHASLDHQLKDQGYPVGTVSVEVGGKAFYTGAHTFVLEDCDILGSIGFSVERM